MNFLYLEYIFPSVLPLFKGKTSICGSKINADKKTVITKLIDQLIIIKKLNKDLK